MSLLEIEGVTRRYPGASEDAVHEITLALEAGVSMALVGESGSGKTTLLRCIAGFEQPDRGQIRFQGKDWVSPSHFVPPEKRGVGMLFQDYALFPHLTVGANVAFGLRHLSRADQEKTASRALEQVRLANFAHRYPHQLSGGQQQRVALARALAPAPRLLLLDEPFSNLDEMVKAEVRDDLYNLLHELGIATLSVIHDTRDALRSADQIALMAQGRLLQVGSPQDLYTQPTSCYVARFFGQTNLLPVEQKHGRCLSALGELPGPQKPLSFEKGWLCLRPEHIRFDIPENIEGLGFVLQTQVRSCRFLGAFWELHLSQETAETEKKEGLPSREPHLLAHIPLHHTPKLQQKQPIFVRFEDLHWLSQ